MLSTYGLDASYTKMSCSMISMSSSLMTSFYKGFYTVSKIRSGKSLSYHSAHSHRSSNHLVLLKRPHLFTYSDYFLISSSWYQATTANNTSSYSASLLISISISRIYKHKVRMLDKYSTQKYFLEISLIRLRNTISWLLNSVLRVLQQVMTLFPHQEQYQSKNRSISVWYN